MFSIPIYVACQLVILEVNKSDNNDGFFPFPTTAVSVFFMATLWCSYFLYSYLYFLMHKASVALQGDIQVE